MILSPGMKVLVVHRRLFENDHERFFLGVVDGYADGLARVSGYTWLRDAYSSGFYRKDDERTKILSLTSGTLIVYQLPSSVDLEQVFLRTDGERMTLTDGRTFDMDLTERSHQRGVQHGRASAVRRDRQSA